ncbi:MAG: hypothetical protein R2737_10320 [Candidatus Nanopelagicales bacterium]
MTAPLDDLLSALARARSERHLRAPAPSTGAARLKHTSRPPLPLELLDALAEADRLLRSWAELVIVKRRLRGPSDLSATSLAAWLRQHADWIESEGLGDDFDSEVDSIATRLNGVLEGEFGRRRPLGRCVVDGCDGWLRISKKHGLEVFCERCGDTWDAGSLPRLGRILAHRDGDGPPPSAVHYNRLARRIVGPAPHRGTMKERNADLTRGQA